MPSELDTHVHFHHDITSLHTQWHGLQHLRSPFQVITKRAHSDVFVNCHHAWTSIVLGCNTNIQIGLDGKHIMYCTLYTGKSNQAEDSQNYLRVAKNLGHYIQQQQRHMAASGEHPSTPFQIGYLRLLGAVLANSSAHVISAPLASFIIHEGSRFIKSHDTVTMPIPAFFKQQLDVKLELRGKRSYFNNLLFNYQYRPTSLEHLCAYDFFEQYEMTRLKKDDPSILSFQCHHPGKALDGLKRRISDVVPILGFSNFMNVSHFQGQSILHPNITSSDDHSVIIDNMAEYAIQIFMLFIPWRDQTILQFDSVDCIKRLQHAHQEGMILPKHLQMLQNMQDCYDSLASDIPPDPLESCTSDLMLDDDINSDEQREAIEQFLAEEMSEIASILSDTFLPFEQDNDCMSHHNSSISLDKIRAQGAHNCGFDFVRAPFLTPCENSFITLNDKISAIEPDDPILATFHSHDDTVLTNRRLFQLIFQSTSHNLTDIQSTFDDIVADGSMRSINAWADLSFTHPETKKIDEDQKRAFQVIIGSFLLTYLEEADKNDSKNGSTLEQSHRAQYNAWKHDLLALRGIGKENQLIAFLTGPGGSGKSHVIATVLRYSRAFTKLLKVPFTKRTIVVTAMTGVAATSIFGETIHSATMLLSQKEPSLDQIKPWKDARLLILDEISFAGKDVILKLDERLRELKENQMAKYGGMNIVFAGDFSQLEPVKGDPLYSCSDFIQWHQWINCFMELHGNHRFATDPLYGDIMNRFCNGKPTMNDLQTLNSRVVPAFPDHFQTGNNNLPEGISYATYYNKDKDAINAGIFHHHLKQTHSQKPSETPPSHTIIIKAADLIWRFSSQKRNAQPLCLNQIMQSKIYAECGSHNMQSTSKFCNRHVDPFLKLHIGIPLMMTVNADVLNGIANGTLCYLKAVILKSHMASIPLPTCCVDGYYVNVVLATDVDHLVCQHANSSDTFIVRMEQDTKVRTKISFNDMLGLHLPFMPKPSFVSMSVSQFPVLVNHACTGHKLQGQTKHHLFISSWSYTKNWPYVMLSRVTSLLGLFLRKPLELDPEKYGMSKLLQKMLRRFLYKTPRPVDDSTFN